MANMSVICIVVLCLSFSLREVTVAAISASDLQDLPETHMNVVGNLTSQAYLSLIIRLVFITLSFIQSVWVGNFTSLTTNTSMNFPKTVVDSKLKQLGFDILRRQELRKNGDLTCVVSRTGFAFNGHRLYSSVCCRYLQR